MTEAASARVARKYDRLIQNAVVNLRRFPEIGAPRTELGEHARIVVVDPYIIFYDWLSGQNTALILRIQHGRQEISKELVARGRV